MKRIGLILPFLTLACRLMPDCSDPGVIAYYALSSTTNDACDTDPSKALLINGSITFTASAAGCASAEVAGFYLNQPGPNIQTQNFLSAPPAILAAMSNLPQYTIQFTYTQNVFSDVTGNQIYQALYDSSNPQANPLPGEGCVNDCDGDVLYISNETIVWSFQHGELFLYGNYAFEGGLNYVVTLTYDGTNYYIYVNGNIVAGPVPMGSPYSNGQGSPYTEITNFTQGTMTSIQFQGGDACEHVDGVNGEQCQYGFYSNVLFSNQAFVPGGDPPCYTLPTATPSPTGQCPVSILKPPDGTVGAVHTVLVTCTLVQSPTNTPTQEISASPTQVVTATGTPTPTATPTGTPTLTASPTATISATLTVSPTMTPTPGCSNCIGAGPIAREPQGHGASWSNDTVPFGQPVVTLDTATGEQNTMAWIGCAVTCFSMIDSTYDPGAMDSELSKAPSKIDLTSMDLNFPKAANFLEFSYSDVSSPTSSDIVDALCGQGNYPGSNYVIAVVLSSGHDHYVVVTGQKINPLTGRCDFTIADPAKANNLFLSDYGGTSDIRILSK
jgi:hypothetical protein